MGFKNKNILITGAAGTIGQELIRQLLGFEVREIKAFDNNESDLFYLNETYRNDKRVNGFFGDIRDLNRLTFLCKDVDIILHTAAMKHVGISEVSPLDAVKTNVVGTSNVIEAALSSEKVSQLIYTSSDKAVNSTNVMGTTKLLGERLISSALNIKTSRKIIFSCTRFGNVIGSKGSVVPVFYKQIRDNSCITLTDKNMTRFVMTIPEAAGFLLNTADLAKGGEVFVTKMRVMRIVDLANAMIDIIAPLFGKKKEDIKIELIGKKPGEKLFEELMTDDETKRAIELPDMFLIKPAFPSIYGEIDYESDHSSEVREVRNPYISSNESPMTVDEIKNYLLQNKIIERQY
jgi:FlaA1/EpsC-like NDP-sugar epimerase